MSKTQEKLTVEYKSLKNQLKFSNLDTIKNINWKKTEIRVLKLQKRIYQASERGDIKILRKLQKTMLNSWSTKCLAFRQVTEKTKFEPFELDTLKNLSTKEMVDFITNVTTITKAKTTKQIISIPVKPLKIVSIKNQVCKTIVNKIIEPEWEAKLEHNNSNFFLETDSCEKKIKAIKNFINKKPKYVLFADIKVLETCLTNTQLLHKLKISSKLSFEMKSCIKSEEGFEKDLLGSNHISKKFLSLLFKIAIYEIQENLQKKVQTISKNSSFHESALHLISYENEFLIFHDHFNIILECKKVVEELLIYFGVPEQSIKIIISHTLHKMDDHCGFDFLGFNIRQYELALKNLKNDSKKTISFVTKITLSNTEVKNYLVRLSRIINLNKSSSQEKLIIQLNHVIYKWLKSYSWLNNQKLFSKIDYLIWQKLRSWAKRKSKGSINKNKYWRQVGNKNWCFSTENGVELIRHTKNF
jgi:RNA-directed DNA polymerase